MARTTSYTLTEQDEAFIQNELAIGAAANASEVVREALRRYRRQRELSIDLDRKLEEGMRSPRAPEGAIDRVVARLRSRR
jgi:putative addiction module CopG family antidote